MKFTTEITWNKGIDVFKISFGNYNAPCRLWNDSDDADKDWGFEYKFIYISRYTLPF